MSRDHARGRTTMRIRDIAESKQLLFELTSREPTLLQCFNIVEAVCLTHGVHCQIDGEPVSKEFKIFLERVWTPFLRACIRSFFTFGFVPWIVRKDVEGNDVPDVLPAGTFDWWTEVTPTDAGAMVQQTDPGIISYRIQLTTPMRLKDANVHIYKYMPPTIHVESNSFLFATVSSPLCHVLNDYKNLRQAQIRRAYADSWNTTAKLICAFKPPYKVQEDPSANLMDFADEGYFNPSMNLLLPGMAPLQAVNMWTRDTQIRRQFAGASVHEPDVFTLPKDHDIVPQITLTPCEDIEFLISKFQRDVCAIVGIPEEMVLTRAKARQADTVHRTLAAGKIFTSNMKQVCSHLREVALDAYHRIYGKRNARFEFIPMPRLEVEKIEDLKILFEIGALNPDASLHLTELLLGEEIMTHKRRAQLDAEGLQAQQAQGKDDGEGKGGFDRATPSDLKRIKKTLQPDKSDKSGKPRQSSKKDDKSVAPAGGGS